MKKTITVSLLLVLLLAASAAPLFAQARGAFSITCNLTGARVYLNGELAGYTKPTFSALLKPGTYQVRVTMDKYRSFETAITMSANPLNLSVNLVPEGAVSPQPPRYTLTVTASPSGAQVFVNNAPAGNAPLSVQVERGSYSLRVSAPGYQEYLTTVNVAENTAVNAVLQASLLQLAVNCNVHGAQVYVNNVLMGSAPFAASFAPGTYTVRVSASGYTEASTVVHLSRNETVSLMLQSSAVSVQVLIPQEYLDPQNRNAQAQIKVYVDGKFINSFSFSVPAGRHNIRISSGGLSFAADYDFAPGRSYVVEPAFGWNVR